jgi:hypothetical protein
MIIALMFTASLTGLVIWGAFFSGPIPGEIRRGQQTDS